MRSPPSLSLATTCWLHARSPCQTGRYSTWSGGHVSDARCTRGGGASEQEPLSVPFVLPKEMETKLLLDFEPISACARSEAAKDRFLKLRPGVSLQDNRSGVGRPLRLRLVMDKAGRPARRRGISLAPGQVLLGVLTVRGPNLIRFGLTEGVLVPCVEDPMPHGT
jgi:hypothetical protein